MILSQELLSLFILFLIFLGDAQFLFRHVDTIKELTDILVAHQHRQMNLRGYPSHLHTNHTRNRHSLDIISLKNDLILLSIRLRHSHSLLHGDVTHSLLSEEVTNLHLLSLLVDGYVDGEVSVHKTHLVTISVSHASDHVADVRADCPYHRNVLVESEPEIHDHSIALLANVHKLVGEVTVQSTTRSCHSHTTILNTDLHYKNNSKQGTIVPPSGIST